MRLVVDTSVVIGESLRVSGRARLGDGRLELFLPERMRAETAVELPRRIDRFAKRRELSAAGREELLVRCTEAIDDNLAVLQEPIYSALEDEALARSVRDPTDWPVVACALALSAGVWTEDNDFLGTGVPTWTTATLSLWLERRPDG